MKIYNVYHLYDIDGGYGDAQSTEEFIATFVSETDAKSFVEKYNKPYVYEKPYQELYCNCYVVRETEIITHEEFDINKTPEDYGAWLPEPLKGFEDERETKFYQFCHEYDDFIALSQAHVDHSARWVFVEAKDEEEAEDIISNLAYSSCNIHTNRNEICTEDIRKYVQDYLNGFHHGLDALIVFRNGNIEYICK